MKQFCCKTAESAVISFPLSLFFIFLRNPTRDSQSKASFDNDDDDDDNDDDVNDDNDIDDNDDNDNDNDDGDDDDDDAFNVLNKNNYHSCTILSFSAKAFATAVKFLSLWALALTLVVEHLLTHAKILSLYPTSSRQSASFT